MNNITTETTIEGALKAYMATKGISDMSKDPRQIEEVMNEKGIQYTSEILESRNGDPKIRVLKFTTPSGWKRTVLASLEGPGIEGAYYDNYDYFSGDVVLSHADWFAVEELLERKYS